jgi:transcription elongation factor Elf1
MKSKRKCNDCGGDMRCYASVSKDKTKTQFFRCDVCELRVRIALQVISEKVKRLGEKVFSESISTTTDTASAGS